MAATAPIAASNTVSYQSPAPPAPAAAADGLSFRDILSDLNPLQYLPVVGTLYRAITGDTIPRPLREAGSLVVSGLMGGPIGVATNLAMLGFEKLTGIDLEEVEQKMLTAVTTAYPGAISRAMVQTASVEGAGPSAQALAAASPVMAQSAPAPAATTPWSPAQLAAYGVVKGPDGDLHQAGLSGADVLNSLQLRFSAGAGLAA